MPHVIEPPELYFDGLDPKFRDRVTVDTEIGDHHGRLMPLLDGQPSYGGSPWMKEVLRSDEGRQVLVDRFGDLALRGFSPDAMLEALDRQGVERAALYPSFSLHTPYADHLAPDLAAALARAYNRWIGDFCRQATAACSVSPSSRCTIPCWPKKSCAASSPPTACGRR